MRIVRESMAIIGYCHIRKYHTGRHKACIPSLDLANEKPRYGETQAEYTSRVKIANQRRWTKTTATVWRGGSGDAPMTGGG